MPVKIKSTFWPFAKNRTGRAKAGLLVDYIGTISNTGLVFLITPLLLGLLTPPMYGFWIAITQVMFWLNLMDGGAGIFLLKGIASANETGNRGYIQRLIGTTFWSYVALGILTLIVGTILAYFIPGWMKVALKDVSRAFFTFEVCVINASISMTILPCFYGILQGYQRLTLTNGIAHGVNILGMLTALGLLLLGRGIEAMALGQLAATLLGVIIAYLTARRICPAMRLSPNHFSWAELRQIFHFTGYFQMSKFSYIVSMFTDGILIANAYGTTAVAIYSLTQKLAGTSSTLINKVGAAVMPGLTEVIAANDTARLQSIILRLTRLLTRFGFFSFVLILTLNHRFVARWVGVTMYGGTILTILFAYSMFRGGLIRNFAAVLFSAGEVRGWGCFSLLEGAINVGLTILWLPKFGIAGAAMATVAAELALTLYAPMRVAQLVQLPLLSLLWRGVCKPLLYSLPMIGALVILNYLLPMQWGWCAMGILGLSGVVANTLVFDWPNWKHLLRKRA